MSELYDAVREGKLTEFQPDPHNANKGTERGSYMVAQSVSKLGMGRSFVVDRNGFVIAGNKTQLAALDSGIDDVIIVQTDGTKGVVVQRTDLDLLTDAKAKELAIADNRVSEVSLQWDTEVLKEIGEEVELTDWFFEDEIENWNMAPPEDSEWGDAFDNLPDGDRAPFQQMTFTLHDEQVEQVKAALESSKKLGSFDSENENSNGNALARICELFLTEHGNS